MSYYITIKKTVYVDSIGYARAYFPSREYTQITQHVTDELPALFIDRLKRRDIEDKAYEPCGNHGKPYNITYMIMSWQEVDDVHAEMIRASKIKLTQEIKDYNKLRLAQRAAEKERCRVEDEERRQNYWYRQLWRWIMS